MYNIGIMQGRLSPRRNKAIQAFPLDSWCEEFPLAKEIGFSIFEWVLDFESVDANPLLSPEGRKEINAAKSQYGVDVPSVCCDYFMEVPFTAESLSVRLQAQGMLAELIRICPEVGIRYIELPLIGKASIEEEVARNTVARLLADLGPLAYAHKVLLILELSLQPRELGLFMNALGEGPFGVNYDLGNSAYWGYSPKEEFAAYGSRIANVHIKDCTQKDYSVPLGLGDVDFELCFDLMRGACYRGDFILQTARQADDIEAAKQYLQFTNKYAQKYLK